MLFVFGNLLKCIFRLLLQFQAMPPLFKLKFPVIISLSLLLLFSCNDGPEPIKLTPEEIDFRNQIVTVMNYWYLWNDQVPEVNINDYATSQDLMDAMINNEFDRWSYVTDAAAFDQYFSQGTYAGHGFGIRFDTDGALRITFVYPGSPADQSGVTRGFEVLEINGRAASTINNIDEALGEDVEGVTNQFKMRNTEGEVVDVEISKSEVNIVTVLDRRIIEQNGQKIGYLVFNNFIERATDDLKEAFSFFATEGVDELVLDLRYNGGGILDIAVELSSMITNTTNAGDILVEVSHNDERVYNNKKYLFENQEVHLGLDRVVIITTDASASASEVVVNCLKPYINVVTIGSTSYGKPVGSYGFRYEGNIISPISFRVVNVEGKADYFEGLPVNSQVADDITSNFGNPEEACLKEALYYLETGGFNNSGSRISPALERANQQLMRGFRAEIGAF